MQMKRFKVIQQSNEIFEISRDEYEKQTQNSRKHTVRGKDGELRNFAVCPACNNPIQIIGLYKKLENRPYGKHYCRGIELAEYNEQAYLFCPYSYRSHQVTKDSSKKVLTDYEKSIYYAVRENFDLAVYIIRQDTGIYISEKQARKILEDYLAASGYMYDWATLYNIPWMLMYFTRAQHCYQMYIQKESSLYRYFLNRNDVLLEQYHETNYYAVKNKPGTFLNLEYSTILHRRKVEDDEVKETINLNIFYWDEKAMPRNAHSVILSINEIRFPNLICNAKYRDEKFLNIARDLMPDLE